MFRLFPCFAAGCLAALCSSVASAANEPGPPPQADLVVYGATASGVITAYAAAQQGLRVVLLEPTGHIGGMVTGGLSATDTAQFKVIGGYSREFYRRAAAHYGTTTLNKRPDWLSEPHVGEAVFQAMLKESNVDLHLHERLKEHGGVQMKAGHLDAVTTDDGRRWAGKIFADCTYEGDLMAQAKVRYTFGRESSTQYGEDLAGVRAMTPKHQFTWPVSGYDDAHKLLPEVQPGPLAAPGTGDKKVQSYNFRLILTNDPANRVAYPRPDGYDPAEFALLRRYLSQYKAHAGHEPAFGDVVNPVCFANHKCDFNNNGPFSTDYIGHSWTYPDASYTERARIWHDTLHYTQCFIYFLAHDPGVPAELQKEANEWGLSRDEFGDSDNWPNQLYIREARRMLGTYVMKQADLQTDRTKTDTIGMGSYNSDSHNIQRVTNADGSVTNEGDVQVPVQPYEIPYRIMLPLPDQAQNLLVPVCFSATHVAYSSVRMEPQYMILGQAAGTAASLAVRGKIPVQQVSVTDLQSALRSHGAYLNIDDVNAAATKRGESTVSAAAKVGFD